ncbi:hypothetical protein HELRODRAFT_127280, partial [Helobdella robusta]|uniref:BHLH domain-containing protein n=1 Tax=Helobdella robusta TaxID=6412 RepID=T1EHD5_HELRO
IERRRRSKMATLLNELAEILPANQTPDQRKPDKLTMLKLATDYMKTLNLKTYGPSSINNCKFATDAELKKLILDVTGGFLFAVLCDSGEVIYVSENVGEVLGCSQAAFYNENLFNLVHPTDIDALKQ